MDWYTALRLAQALLEEMDFDPEKVIALDDEDLADKLGYLEDDLAEALLSFCQTLEDDARFIRAAKRFAERPKNSADLESWQTDKLYSLEIVPIVKEWTL